MLAVGENLSMSFCYWPFREIINANNQVFKYINFWKMAKVDLILYTYGAHLPKKRFCMFSGNLIFYLYHIRFLQNMLFFLKFSVINNDGRSTKIPGNNDWGSHSFWAVIICYTSSNQSILRVPVSQNM